MIQPELTMVPARFNGPNRSGNGGWVSGHVAARLTSRTGADTVTVTLRQPPPLETALTWQDGRDAVTLLHEGAVVGEAAPGAFDDDAPAAVTHAVAEQARADFEGYHDHPFPRCFTCGSDRHDGDGLRLFSGPVGDGRMAATWTPHAAFCDDDGTLTPESFWAALDCPGGWAAGIKASPMVLGRMTARLDEAPRA
ncbi:hypothetical protein, partial [Solicola sp. PLA-1-18]|uniref:hypothetical protein n=1 Tax=Solicola sp. PLA-1-18 TaxID=3380532 RepID=UPI003B8120D1